jgi:hypothetical protein
MKVLLAQLLIKFIWDMKLLLLYEWMEEREDEFFSFHTIHRKLNLIYLVISWQLGRSGEDWMCHELWKTEAANQILNQLWSCVCFSREPVKIIQRGNNGTEISSELSFTAFLDQPQSTPNIRDFQSLKRKIMARGFYQLEFIDKFQQKSKFPSQDDDQKLQPS